MPSDASASFVKSKWKAVGGGEWKRFLLETENLLDVRVLFLFFFFLKRCNLILHALPSESSEWLLWVPPPRH